MVNAVEKAKIGLGDNADTTTVERITINALEHFATYGYIGASIRLITQASGVTKPTLYYYFKNKEELFLKVASHCQKIVLDRVEVALAKGNTLLERMQSAIEGAIELQKTHRSECRFIFVLSALSGYGVPEYGRADFVSALANKFHLCVQQAADAGEIPRDKVHEISIILHSVIVGFERGLISAKPESEIGTDRATIESVVRYVLAH